MANNESPYRHISPEQRVPGILEPNGDEPLMGKFKTLLLAHHCSSDHAIQSVVKQFSENVTQRTNGQIAIATVPNSALGNLAALLRLVIDGSADMALHPYDWLGLHAPRFGCVGLPFVFDDHAHADRVLGGAFDAWARPGLDVLGIVFLGSWEWGFRQLSNSRHRILRPEDIRGLKIRVPLVPPYGATFRTFGAIPVMVEYSRMVRVLRQGLIDGHENPLSVIDSLGLQFEQKYLSLLNYSYGMLGHVINGSCFAALSAEQQGILIEESRKAGQLVRQIGRRREVEQLAELASHGVQIDRPDVAPFKALIAPVYAQLRASYGAENIHRFLAMVDDQRRIPEQATP